jgi:pimeloyl-ACP methyl ester carboxylesterase
MGPRPTFLIVKIKKMTIQVRSKTASVSLTAFAFLAAFLLFIVGCSKTRTITPPPARTFVLVHGSFQGPFAWQFVQAQLLAAGQKVVVVELPGHGQDQTPPATLTLNSYRDKVVEAITAVNGPVVLVGHSLGGAIITAVADTIPALIQKLVYLAGFIPTNGQSVIDLNSMDPNSQLTPALMPSADFSTVSVANDKLLSIFCQDGSDAINQLLMTNNRPEPTAPLYSKIVLSNPASAAIPKYYIHTTNDRCITIDLQNQMVATAGLQNVFSIASSHSPHLSMPEKVTSILLDSLK